MNENLYEIDPNKFETEIFCTFQDARSLKTYIYKPKNWSILNKQKSIIFYHGGGFKIGSPERFYPQALHFACKGYVVFVPEYRIESKDGTGALEATKDAHYFFEWVIQNSNKFKINQKRIILGGGSAGGQLAASIANISINKNKNLPKPIALILYNPAINIPPKGKIKDDYFRDYFKDPAKGSLINFPPCIIMHGTNDKVVPFSWISNFVDKLNIKSLDCVFEVYHNKDHGFYNKYISNEDYLKTNKQIELFLDNRGI